MFLFVDPNYRQFVMADTSKKRLNVLPGIWLCLPKTPILKPVSEPALQRNHMKSRIRSYLCSQGNNNAARKVRSFAATAGLYAWWGADCRFDSACGFAALTLSAPSVEVLSIEFKHLFSDL